MKPRRIMTAEEASGMFDEAVRQNALAVLTVHGNGNWHTFKSRFLERDANRHFVVLDYQETHGTQPPPLMPPADHHCQGRHGRRGMVAENNRGIPQGRQA